VINTARAFSTSESTAKRPEGVSGVGVATVTEGVRRTTVLVLETLQLRAATEAVGGSNKSGGTASSSVSSLRYCLVGALLREGQRLGCRKQPSQQAKNLRPDQWSQKQINGYTNTHTEGDNGVSEVCRNKRRTASTSS
jgi:hypothetical protein